LCFIDYVLRTFREKRRGKEKRVKKVLFVVVVQKDFFTGVSTEKNGLFVDNVGGGVAWVKLDGGLDGITGSWG
jgi:hypothetical protein